MSAEGEAGELGSAQGAGALAAAQPELSVIVPVLNEAQVLPRLLAELAAQRGVALEVIVCDGGSRDASAALARAAGARVVEAPRGRGAQPNAGAACARAPELLFLHADTGLPDPGALAGALAALRAERAARGPRAAGHFPLRFSRARPERTALFRHMEEKTRCNRPDTINGDQGALLSAAYFRELGGYDTSLPFLEDQRLAARIFASGRWIVLPCELETSARRFESQGHFRLYTLMSIVMGMQAADVTGFFERAPALYAAQGDLGAGLRLGPYLALVQRLLWEAGLRGAARISWRVGIYVRGHAWQPFFALDTHLRPWLGPGRYPFLALHDRWLYPLIHNRFGDLVTSVSVCGWFLVFLPLVCAFLERRER